jgi:hypothetical protein
LNSMDTIYCKAMMQHANLTFSQFLVIWKHLKHSAWKGFKMMYSPKEKKKLKNGPQFFWTRPMFGEYKYNEGDNGAQVKTVQYCSMNFSKEVH